MFAFNYDEPATVPTEQSIIRKLDDAFRAPELGYKLVDYRLPPRLDRWSSQGIPVRHGGPAALQDHALGPCGARRSLGLQHALRRRTAACDRHAPGRRCANQSERAGCCWPAMSPTSATTSPAKAPAPGTAPSPLSYGTSIGARSYEFSARAKPNHGSLGSTRDVLRHGVDTLLHSQFVTSGHNQRCGRGSWKTALTCQRN